MLLHETVLFVTLKGPVNIGFLIKFCSLKSLHFEEVCIVLDELYKKCQ